jgi:uncharacterized protein
MDKNRKIAEAVTLSHVSSITVSSLHIHPVKSCRAIAVEEAAFDALGMVDDRRFLIVDSAGNFLTQRSDARLALIETDFADGSLILRTPNAREFRLPLDTPSTGDRSITIFRDTVMAGDMGDAAAFWLSAVLAKPSRLVRAGADFSRRVPLERIPPAHVGSLPEVPVAFVDAFPVLVISESSLEHLNAKLEEPLPMNRFRPNIVVRGGAEHAEDRWKVVRVGGVEFRAGGDCGRCVVSTTDQETGERGPEPLVTLAKYRRDDRGAVTFGQYWMHCGPGTIRVGDAVEIVA